MKRCKPAQFNVLPLVQQLFSDDMHAKRVEALANGVTGVLTSATLAVRALGRAYAEASGGKVKHGIKQVDRLLGNRKLDVAQLLPRWVAHVVGVRQEIVVAVDWTDFDADSHATLAAYLVTSHGRATPLMWRTVEKTTLKGRTKEIEYDFVEALGRAIAPEVRVILLADRGFGDRKLYDYLQFAGWDFVIRFRGAIEVRVDEVSQPASAWLTPTGRARMLRHAEVTAAHQPVPAVVVVKAPKMREAWYLATTLATRSATHVVALYGRRFTIEETFRDQKNWRFGLGLSARRISSAARRDRLLLLAAIAEALLTLLGAAGERCGLDRYLKANTSAKRQLSLFNQGLHWWGLLPNMRDDEFAMLMQAYDVEVATHAVFRDVFGVI